MRRREGYLAGVIGSLAGGTVGGALGQMVGVPIASWAFWDVQSDADAVEGAIEGFGLAITSFLVAVIVYFLVVVFVAWLGTVVGCGLALRLAGYDHAARTAVATGCIALPTAYVILWVHQSLFGATRGDTGWMLAAAAVVLSALAARRLALSRPSRPSRPIGSGEPLQTPAEGPQGRP